MLKIGVLLLGWRRTPDELDSAVTQLGTFDSVESASLNGDPRPIWSAVERMFEAEVDRIVLTPSLEAVHQDPMPERLAQLMAELGERYPDGEFVDASGQLTVEREARLLVHALEPFLVDGEAGDLPLAMLSPHQQGIVHKLRGGNEFVSRLAALGFIPGAPVTIEQNFGVGPLIVTVRETRIALGRAEARKIRVRLPQEGNHEEPFNHHERRHHHNRRRHW